MSDETSRLGTFWGTSAALEVERREHGLIVEEELETTVSGNPPRTRRSAFKGSWVLSSTFDSVAIQIGRHVKLLQDIDDARVRELQSKLIVEQSRLCAWARDRNFSSITQVDSMLIGFPASIKAAVTSLCNILETWMQDSVLKLEQYSSLITKSPGNWRERELNFIIDSYHLLEILRTVNNGFYTVGRSLSNRHADTPSTVRHELPGDMPMAIQERSDSMSSSAVAGDNSILGDLSPGFDGVPSSLRAFFTSCSRALKVVITQIDEKERPKRLYARLLVWGCGLFPVSMSLDQILDPDNETHDEAAASFRGHIVGILADIAIILENLLRSFHLSRDPEVHKSMTKLQACFGKYKEFSNEAMEDELGLPDSHNSAEIKMFFDSSMQQLEGLVDCLFQILPSIDRLRQVWLLDLERRSHILSVSLVESAAKSSSQLQDKTFPSFDKFDAERVDPLERSTSSDRLSDELDFRGSVAEATITRPKVEASTQLADADNTDHKIKRALPRRNPETPSYQKYLSTEDKVSLQKLLAMDLELATALRLSVVESQVEAAREKREDKALLNQIQSWDDEIKRLRDWSEAFDASLGEKPSQAETRKQYSIFEQLAKIGGAFTSAMARNKKGAVMASAAKRRLASVTRTMSISAGKKFDFSLDLKDTSLSTALSTFQDANANLRNLAVELE